MRILSRAAIIRRQLICVDQRQESLVHSARAANDFNLAGRTGIEPSLDDAPTGREKGGGIDNQHLGHGFRKANGINRGLFFDNGQGTPAER